MTSWAFLIGIDTYTKDKDFLKLEYCEQHVLDLAHILVEKGDYTEDTIIILTSNRDISPSRNNIMGEFRNFIWKIRPKDKLLIYFIGHGGSCRGKNYIFPNDAYIDYKDLESITESSISLDWFITQLEKFQSQTWDIFFIIDACRERMIESQSANIASKTAMIHGMVQKKIDEYPAGLSFLFSCSSKQRAYSFKQDMKSHSIFSFTLLKGLGTEIKGSITFGKLVQYVKKEVPKIAEKFKRPEQIPVDKSPIEAYNKPILGVLTIEDFSDNPDLDYMINYLYYEPDLAKALYYYQEQDYKNCIKFFELLPENQRQDNKEKLADAYFQYSQQASGISSIEALNKAIKLYPNNLDYIENLTLLEWELSYKSKVMIPVVTPIAIEISNDLEHLLSDENNKILPSVEQLMVEMRGDFYNKFGVHMPGFRFRTNENAFKKGSYMIMLNEIPTASGFLPLSKKLLVDYIDEELLKKIGVKGEITVNPFSSEPAWWIDEPDFKKIEDFGYKLHDNLMYIILHTLKEVKENITSILGHQEVMNTIEGMIYRVREDRYQKPETLKSLEDLNEKVIRTPPYLTALTLICQGLVSEKVPVKSFEVIVKEFSFFNIEESTDIQDIIERIRLLPKIKKELPGNNDKFTHISIGHKEEKLLLQMIKSESNSVYLIDNLTKRYHKMLVEIKTIAINKQKIAIVIHNKNLRPIFQRILAKQLPNIPVLSYEELNPNLKFNIEELELPEEIR